MGKKNEKRKRGRVEVDKTANPKKRKCTIEKSNKVGKKGKQRGKGKNTVITLAEMQNLGYVIKEDGTVLGRKGTIMTRTKHKTAKLIVTINYVVKRVPVAEMVAAAFKPAPANTHFVLYHIDKDLSNCAASNLEWRLPLAKQDETVIWRPIPGYDAHEASNTGHIFSRKTNTTLSEYVRNGYSEVKTGKRDVKVHQLVCLAWHGKAPSSQHTVDHVNRNPLDNRSDNLRWATKTEQGYNRTTKPGLPVQCLDDEGKVIRTYASAKEASETTGISINSIYGCMKNGKKNKHTGSYWRYEPEAKAASEPKLMVPLPQESWSDIPGTHPQLRVSSMGRFAIGNKLKEPFEQGGYLCIHHTIDGVGAIWQTHILVAHMFKPKLPGSENITLSQLRKMKAGQRPVVDHLNEMKHDNRANNLEWTTGRDNTIRAMGVPVVAFLEDGAVHERYPAAILAANEFGCSRNHILQCCREGKTWKGMTWRLETDIAKKIEGEMQ